MNIGKMRHRVTIEQPVELKDSMGGTTKTWIAFHRCWADVRELSGNELTKIEQIQSKVTAKAYIRYRSHITSSMRLIHGDKTYQIEAVINKDGKKHMLELQLYEFR